MSGLTNIEVKAIELQSRAASHNLKERLTKREQFAAMAMQSFILNSSKTMAAEELAIESYRMADLMLAKSKP